MFQGLQSTLRTIVILPDRAARAAFVSETHSDPRFKIIGEFASLGEAYTQIEAHPPDLTICSKDIKGQPEFPMFDAMLSMVGSRLICIHSGAGPGSVARLMEMPPVTAASHEAAPGVAPGTPQRLVAIGASTGGIEALSQVLSGYPENCPPTVIVQHIKPEYLAGVVDRLDRICAAKVVAGASQLRLMPGQVVIAPGLPFHMEVQPGMLRCALVDRPPASGHRPSVDVLFQSVAALKGNALGVILTGMGRDGATGLAAMRAAGAWTIAQDAATSTVHGMPRVATLEGAVCEVLPLHKISKAILAAAIDRHEVTR